jgi:anti-sigma regulatory factor (Ser/Thr protein kinase)
VVPVEWQFQSRDARAALDSRASFARYLAETCTPESDCTGAEVVFGELVANTVRHAPGSIDIRVGCDAEGSVVLEVSDTGPEFPLVPALPSAQCEGGRGLYIVSRLCPRLWKTCGPHGGNTVSAVLPVVALPIRNADRSRLVPAH